MIAPHIDRGAWLLLARDIKDTPEKVLANAAAPASIELAIACSQRGYEFGHLFLQALQLKAKYAGDQRMRARAALLCAELRAMIWADADAQGPIVDARRRFGAPREKVNPIIERARAE